jgi:hypothetical protein
VFTLFANNAFMKFSRHPQLGIISITVFGVCVFVLSSMLVFAQGFTEPTANQTVPAPVTTSNAPQAIEGVLGVGVTSPTMIPVNTTLFVDGRTISKDWNGVEANMNVGSDTFSIQGSVVQFDSACPGGVKACAIADTETLPGIDINHATGTALFGQTSVGARAGVYGEGYYGIWGKATASSGVGVVGSSCTELAGAPGVCTQYGNAGYFVGNNSAGIALEVQNGYISGDGGGLYKAKSIKNLQKPTEEAISYKSYSVVLTTSSPTTISNVGDAEAVIAVESDSENGVFVPSGKWSVVTFDPNAKSITVSKAAGAPASVYVRLVVSYINNP